jgi:hypothetical protein
MKKIIIAISILVLISLIGGIFYYVSGTPKYSLNKLIQTIKNRDSASFNKYVDIERVSRNFIEDASQESLQGEVIIKFAKEKMQSEVDKSIENPSDEVQTKLEDIKVKKIMKNGKTAKAILENKNKEILAVDMIQTSDRYWKIVKVNTNDLMKIYQKVTVTLIINDLEKNNLNSDEIKEKILGKTEEQLKEILKSYPQIKKIEVEYYPSYSSGEIPENGDKVEIKMKSEDRKTKGKITIYNEYSPNPQPLVATTRLLSESGKMFRLVNDAIIPGFKKTNNGIEAGTIQADVISDGLGEEYNIAPSKFVIPGFKSINEEKYFRIYAKSEEAMTNEY